MDNVDLSQPAFVFWTRLSRFHPGKVTRFDHLENAIDCIMQHALARTASVAWIKTMNQHLEMDQIRSIARHSSLVNYLSKAEQGTSASVERTATITGRLRRAMLG
jgi:hypothetical protein